MNILIVYAHQEPVQFTAAMKNMALQILEAKAIVVVSDLYGQGFSAIAQKWDFVTTSGNHYNYMLEQKHAANLDMAFSPDISGRDSKNAGRGDSIICHAHLVAQRAGDAQRLVRPGAGHGRGLGHRQDL